ncbi:MAG: NAD(P)-binding domain-containing protein [Candidatus Deferrimicrobiaceae bacterium]
MEIAMIGLGKMGANMTTRLLGKGHRVVAYDVKEEAVRATEAMGAVGARTLDEVVGKLTVPRAVWVMVPAGQITDDTIIALADRLSPGDVVIDGGNSNYKDTMRRAAALKDIGSFSGKSSESTWMVGIREAPLSDGDLREHPDPSSFDGSGHWTSGPTDWGGNPADLYREKKFLDQLTECLSGLSPNHANAFTLREIEGEDTGEICKVLNVTETNLWVILHRARMQLRRCLETRWFHRKTEKEP